MMPPPSLVAFAVSLDNALKCEVSQLYCLLIPGKGLVTIPNGLKVVFFFFLSHYAHEAQGTETYSCYHSSLSLHESFPSNEF